MRLTIYILILLLSIPCLQELNLKAFKNKDKMKGGLADKSKYKDFDTKEMEMGIAIEQEHTNDRFVSREIASDHLKEDPKYYTHLKAMEKKHQKRKEI